MNPADTLLLDTHIWIEWVQQGPRLPVPLKDVIEGHEGPVAVSAVSIYETLTLAKRQRITLNREVEDWVERATTAAGVEVLPVDDWIARQAGHLPPIHGDPMDRLIIATAIVHQAWLVSFDAKFPRYEVLGDRVLNGKKASP